MMTMMITVLKISDSMCGVVHRHVLPVGMCFVLMQVGQYEVLMVPLLGLN